MSTHTATNISGVDAIAAERARQQTDEGYTREYDAHLRPQVLIDAALAYTVQAQDQLSAADGQGVGADSPESYWPWELDSFRPNDDELRSLAKAGALLAAAYDCAVARRVQMGEA
ncbi:MAG: hypothetical protein EKK51_21160 [Mycolicibacterium sp.]|uniref:hypothetical protein n=1 Tax=Mycobacteriaceae TaxID=1762 RepID=UPI000FB64805|nr:hypothetical protein [Mycolicibacterium sp.]RUP29195.1 MAG: hypothetical protein EKK51_21160 [Mycolicibacterium sp.]